jgi:hypothetical protein
MPGGFAPPRKLEQGFIGSPLISTAGVGVLEIRAKQNATVQIVLDALSANGTRRTLRIADSKEEQSFDVTGKTRISVIVQVPRGVSQLLVKTDPPPTSEADALVLSTPHATKSSAAPSLHADRVSAEPGF